MDKGEGMTMVRVRLLMVCLSITGVNWIVQDHADAQSDPGSPPASVTAVPPAPPAAASSVPQPGGAGLATEPVIPAGRGGYVYLPEGRRDPFVSMLRDSAGADSEKKTDEINLPPLQRVTVAECTVIGIVWGGFGYTAMVQTPDGRGYVVQRGARIGSNNGVVSAITEKAVIVEERFTDIYGKKQVREYAKPLHVKESQP
ncbi:MAG TPA: pilus assembly protein PilP [Nitrospiraceae bacterium]